MTAHSIGTSGFPFSFRLDNEMEVPEAPVDSGLFVGLVIRFGRDRGVCALQLLWCAKLFADSGI